MSPGPGSRDSRLKQISEAIGLLAAVASTVYLIGAFILALRLQTHDLPTLAVLSNLPRELVVSVGLTYGVVPWLLLAVAVALFWLLTRRAPTAGRPKHLVDARAGAGAVALAVVSVLVAWVVLRGLDGPFGRWDIALLGVSSLAVALFAVSVWRLLVGRYSYTWTRPAAIAAAAALAGLVAVPPFIAVGARAPFDEAQLCGEGQTHLKGWLVGEAGDRVYIGENVHPHRIVSAPRTAELYVGPGAAAEFLCRRELLLLPTADQLLTAALNASTCAKCSGSVAAIRVSSERPWLASAVVEGRRRGRVAFRGLLVFRRAEAEWRVVSVVPSASVACDSLEEHTGVDATVLEDLRVCLSDPAK